MNYTKLAMAGLTAALTFSGAVNVFAEESAATGTQQSALVLEEGSAAADRSDFRKKTDMAEIIDMSGLELPEGFVPFDENHVPDGKHAPENGEIKPIEFDEDGNMIFGQKPEGRPPMGDGQRPVFEDGRRPEFPDGEMPDFAEGERPELPDGEMPDFAEGERPELPDGKNTQNMNSQVPQAGGQSQTPQIMNGDFQENTQTSQTGGFRR